MKPSGKRHGVGSRFAFATRKRIRGAPIAGPFPRIEASRPVPAGFTLLEIILALAILAGALAALGEVMRLGDQNASLARDESQAQVLASSVMDELIAGVRQVAAIDRAQLGIDADPPWLYSVAIEQTSYNELVAVRVLVEQQADARLQPARFELLRWLPNPNYIPADTSTQSSTTSSTGSGSTSGSGSLGGSSGSGGGGTP